MNITVPAGAVSTNTIQYQPVINALEDRLRCFLTVYSLPEALILPGPGNYLFIIQTENVLVVMNFLLPAYQDAELLAPRKKNNAG